jgi:hypothetical protein
LQKRPGPVGVERLFPGIHNLFDGYLLTPKKLLGIGAGRSPLAQISPIDLHLLLLSTLVLLLQNNTEGTIRETWFQVAP